MVTLLKDSGVEDLYEKVVAGQRISDADCLRLYRTRDINAVGAIANLVRERKNGNRATFIHNFYINYSNVCILTCSFCAYARKKRQEGAFEYSVEEIVEKARGPVAAGVTEIHIVGGLHPSLPFSYYTDMLRGLKGLNPNLHLKVFTAVEILHLAWRGKMDVRKTFETLREAGLGSITGGGAEIFAPKIREEICRGKESAEEWLDVHRTWHQMGGRSSTTMLYGHIEGLEDRVDHLRRLRELQDETGGFTTFVPFAYEPENTPLEKTRPLKRTSAVEDLRNIAVSRIYLDNFDHVTAYWIAHGPKLSQIALSYGADDLHGTIFEEKIFHMAGARTPQEMAQEQLIASIREAGREPMQRDSTFEIVNQPSPAVVAIPRELPAPIGANRNSARLACVPYLNALPVIWGLEDRLTYLEPSRMAEQLRAGKFDGGLVPILECLECDDYEIVADVAIASRGPVKSVLLAYEPPLEAITEVAVDPASKTSVALLKVILQERYHLTPKFTTLQDEASSRACLLIGDRALKFIWSHPNHHTLDLASEWYELTKGPMVFAVWALRRGTDTNAVAAMLRRAKEEGMTHLDEIIAKLPADQREFLRAYFTKYLTYNLGEAEMRGIERFQQSLLKLGELPVTHKLRYV